MVTAKIGATEIEIEETEGTEVNAGDLGLLIIVLDANTKIPTPQVETTEHARGKTDIRIEETSANGTATEVLDVVMMIEDEVTVISSTTDEVQAEEEREEEGIPVPEMIVVPAKIKMSSLHKLAVERAVQHRRKESLHQT